MATIKKRIVFLLPVDFRADSERGLKEAIAAFRADPVYQSDGVGPSGYYGWTQGNPRLKPRRKRQRPGDGD